jgi:hypothetical protein
MNQSPLSILLIGSEAETALLSEALPGILSQTHAVQLRTLIGKQATLSATRQAWREVLQQAGADGQAWIHFSGLISAQGWHLADGYLPATERENWLSSANAPGLLISADPTRGPEWAPAQLPAPAHQVDYLYLSCVPDHERPLPPMEAGYFTRALLHALPAALDGPYAHLMTLLRYYLGPDGWTPSLEGSRHAHAWQRLLTQDNVADIPTVPVIYQDQRWHLAAGALQGIGPEDLDSSFPIWGTSIDDPRPGHLQLQRLGLERSPVRVIGTQLDQGRRYLSALPSQGMPVFIEGQDLQATASIWRDHPTLIPVHAADGARYAIRQTEQGTGLFRQTPEQLVMGIEAPLAEALPTLLSTLETMARWERTLTLSNPDSALPPEAITLEIWPEGHTKSVASEEWIVDITGESGEVKFGLYAENRSQQPLYIALLYADNRFGVTPITPRDLESEPLYPRERHALIPKGKGSLSDLDPNRSDEHLILLASVAPFPSGLLAQSALPAEQLYRWLGQAPAPRMLSRNLSTADPIGAWTSRRVTISLRRQKALLGDQAGSLAQGTITIQPHPQLRGYASLQGPAPVSRGINSEEPKRVMATIPGISPVELAEDKDQRDIFALPVDHLEIVSEGLVDSEMLRTQPLTLEWQQAYAEGEALLPMAFDGEFWIPVGKSQRTEDGNTRIEIDHWPEEKVKSRSIGQALKLYFFKAVMSRPGTQFQRVIFHTDGRVERTEEGLQTAIDQAQRVLIVTHGIIGNTQDIAGSLRFAQQEGYYDLVLTFDYENLSTPISETARRLKRLIQQHGLEQKTIDIVAHSMGGLVGRWLIEREGGDAFIRRLMMLGTPNGGSAFSMLAPVIPALIALAANLKSPLLGGLFYAMQMFHESSQINRTLSDMDKESDMLLTLNTSEPPQAEYIIIAGDATAYESKATSRMARLMDKALTAVGNLAYRKQRHDVAVALESMRTLPNGMNAQVFTEPGHHLIYFSFPATVSVLEDAIRQPSESIALEEK